MFSSFEFYHNFPGTVSPGLADVPKAAASAPSARHSFRSLASTLQACGSIDVSGSELNTRSKTSGAVSASRSTSARVTSGDGGMQSASPLAMASATASTYTSSLIQFSHNCPHNSSLELFTFNQLWWLYNFKVNVYRDIKILCIYTILYKSVATVCKIVIDIFFLWQTDFYSTIF